jgi:hypothetical protein
VVRGVLKPECGWVWRRYIFEEREGRKGGVDPQSPVIARLQECGPRFTLKLVSLQKGTFDSKHGELEWVHKVSPPRPRKPRPLVCTLGPPAPLSARPAPAMFSSRPWRGAPRSALRCPPDGWPRVCRRTWTLAGDASSYNRRQPDASGGKGREGTRH